MKSDNKHDVFILSVTLEIEAVGTGGIIEALGELNDHLDALADSDNIVGLPVITGHSVIRIDEDY